MGTRQKLAEYNRRSSEDITRWEKVTYRTNSSDKLVKKSVRGKRSVLFLDTAMFRRMLDPLSLSSHRIAHLIVDEAEFGTNLYHGTYEEIQEELNLSKGSVVRGMADLEKVDFVRKVKNGRYMLNPAVGTKCYAEDIDKLRDIYSKLEQHAPKTGQKGEFK